MELEVIIEHLGAQGDGVAQGPSGPLFVPFTLPGERALVAVEAEGARAELLRLLEASPARRDPVCRHFASCGGCALQHLQEGAYLAWKREQVVTALRQRGIEADVEPVLSVPLGTRCRASFALTRGASGVTLGYRRARSHALVEIEECPVLIPRVVAALPSLRELLAPLAPAKGEARIGITDTEAGLDLVVEGAASLGPAALAQIAARAVALPIARLCIGREVVALRAQPTIRFGRAEVKLPPGAFLQASLGAEAALVELVREGVKGAKRIADLFAGLGTFAFALAEQAKVDAFEQDDAALEALAEAARNTQGLKPIRTFARDLFRNPLAPTELKIYDAVVFDPPRAGAKAQSQALAASRVPRIVAVSCNPATLARDLRILLDGGYRLARIVPVDQFRFSAQIEAVAHLTR